MNQKSPDAPILILELAHMTDASIAAASDFKQAQVRDQITYALMAKQMDAVRQQGDAAVQLLEAAANAGKAVDRGHGLDLVG
ncbi:MAG: hypothetical protein KDA61_16855 [Planctomycetales bacterium]|nr:hypothetical protein [Planctomycetales bacterium]